MKFSLKYCELEVSEFRIRWAQQWAEHCSCTWNLDAHKTDRCKFEFDSLLLFSILYNAMLWVGIVTSKGNHNEDKKQG
jgi:hypothetical protein